MTITIARERPDTPEAIAFITELDDYLAALYPPESNHGLSVAALLDPAVAFFVLRQAGEAVGCGALKFCADYAEVKRMFIHPRLRGQGLSKRMLLHLEQHARQERVALLRLEVGIHQPEALGLYERMGFCQIAPFGDYQPDPLSLFFEKRLED
ncbi:MAG: GNAT family N-acetyltransferase [Chloroflexaceae bacterium]|jgi:putative acetyltransferase|nr:GNAT family N-acetyltransferase [Chloroflexaceae bacterium]